MFWTRKSPIAHIPTKVVNALESDFSDFELAKLSQLGTLVELESGTTLALEGTFGTQAIVMVEGTASVLRNGETVATVSAGDLVGEMALLSGDRRNATVVADTKVSVYALSVQEFHSLLAECPRLGSRVRSIAVQRLASV